MLHKLVGIVTLALALLIGCVPEKTYKEACRSRDEAYLARDKAYLSRDNEARRSTLFMVLATVFGIGGAVMLVVGAAAGSSARKEAHGQ